ncbi:MAG: ABC transporter substrate-binding protein [Proteobacteria bacterium]|nr:ABC transporter substrate-binding protein [Pseudomonadota bacterium]
MKKFFVLAIIFASLAFVLYLKSDKRNHHVHLVGIVQVIEHPALDISRKGMIERLKTLGFKEGENIQFIFESAQGNPALASQIIQKFIGQKVDMIVSLGTTPSQAALQNIIQVKDYQKIQLVFLSVSDPLSAKLVEEASNGTLSSSYACGISNYVDVKKQLEMFKNALPNMLNLGIIYNPGEANSVTSIERFKKWGESFHINIVEAPATKTSDVIMAAQSLKGKVDAIFVDNDNTALAAFSTLSNFCVTNKIPLFVSDTDLAHLALASLGPSQKRIGEQGAEFVALLLKKEAVIKDLGVQFPDTVELFLNEEFAKKIDVVLGDFFIKSAKKV